MYRFKVTTKLSSYFDIEKHSALNRVFKLL